MNGMLLKLELAKPANYNEIQDSTNWLWRTSFDAGVFNGHKLKLLMIAVFVFGVVTPLLQWWVLEVDQLFQNMCKIGQSKPIYDAYWIKFVLLVGWVEQDKVCLKVDRLGTGLLGRPKIFSHTLMWLVMYGHVMALKLCQSYRHTCVYGSIWGNWDKN